MHAFSDSGCEKCPSALKTVKVHCISHEFLLFCLRKVTLRHISHCSQTVAFLTLLEQMKTKDSSVGDLLSEKVILLEGAKSVLLAELTRVHCISTSL